MKRWGVVVGFIVICSMSTLFSQTKDAYNSIEKEKEKSGFLDPSRLQVNNSLSFGAASGIGSSGLQSQSLYTTMLRYQFAAPVTLNLNFSLPIHSTFRSVQNLNSNNLNSFEYFKNIPFEVGLTWQPTKNTLFQFNILKMPQNYFFSPYYNYNDALGTMWK